MKRFSTTLCLLILSAITISYAQISMPQPSPLSTVSQKVGLADVTVTYSRPSVKGRKIFGDLVPYNTIWRTGANAPTKISFSDSVTVAGKVLAPGDYALYTIPGEKEWTVIFGKDASLQAGSHKDGEEAAKFKVNPVKTCAHVETFTIDFNDVTPSSAVIAISWADTKVSFKVENAYDHKVMAEIKQKTAGAADAMTYYQAASYYYETNRDLKQALEWVNKATENDPKFWQLHTKAKIQAKLNDCKGAIETANKSIELAKAAGNDQYVKFNEQLIAECKKKK
ncbi:MAG TPA: DUF2911 domain-containing protein [Cytophagaceae bacterium]